jgi:thiosulfate reductase cytochrome b subunit
MATLRMHPLPIRIMHWINAAAMLVMITSGWGIYDGVIIRLFHFSYFWRLGDWGAFSDTSRPLFATAAVTSWW